ncbi:MAG: VOC family protein [Propionibacteriaceae bacterium]|jgi:predicted enzyme related to lactoylglutathione lyase|nr:VOC family protein [Propionibacteriaceae bacterium]
MSLDPVHVTIDTQDPRRLAAWWAEQTGGRVALDLGGFVLVSTPAGMGLGFQLVAEPTPDKNRLHLDCAASDVAAETERLIAAGASLVARHDTPGFSWTVLSDPDGNQFCVIPTLDDPSTAAS